MRTVFVDVDTQIDFMFPAGALYVPGAEKILPAIRHLNRFAASRGIPVLSDMDAHAEDDPEFRDWPPHCVVGTTGQLKAQDTLLEKRIVVPNTPMDVATAGVEQILMEKQTLDAFTNVNIGQVLGRLNGDEYVVYGVVTEYCVKCATMGLLGTGRPVSVVTDAVETLNAADARKFFEEFRGAGGRLTTVSEACAQ
jgi:nicotinamidase/pyrazinamidase